MPIRVVRLNTRNPIVGLALLLVLLAIVLLVVTFGAAILAGAAVLGGVGLLARRALRLGRRGAPAAERALPPLDPANEVFAPTDAARRLPRAGEEG